MNHSGDGSFRARADVRGGARDRAGGGQATKQGRNDIGDALRHELDVGIVLVVAHAVGDDCGHQRLDGAEHRDGEGRREKLARRVVAEMRDG